MANRSTRPRGASLIEVLVSAFIMALLTGMAITVVLAVTRYYHRTLTSYDLHQDALAALSSLARELSSSHKQASLVGSGGVVFAVPSLDYSQTPTALQWDRWVCYCSLSVQGLPALVRIEQPLVPPSALPPSAVPFDKSIASFQSSGLHHKLVAAYLNSFTVSSDDPAIITLQLSRDIGKLYSVKVSTRVPFRN